MTTTEDDTRSKNHPGRHWRKYMRQAAEQYVEDQDQERQLVASITKAKDPADVRAALRQVYMDGYATGRAVVIAPKFDMPKALFELRRALADETNPQRRLTVAIEMFGRRATMVLGTLDDMQGNPVRAY